MRPPSNENADVPKVRKTNGWRKTIIFLCDFFLVFAAVLKSSTHVSNSAVTLSLLQSMNSLFDVFRQTGKQSALEGNTPGFGRMWTLPFPRHKSYLEIPRKACFTCLWRSAHFPVSAPASLYLASTAVSSMSVQQDPYCRNGSSLACLFGQNLREVLLSSVGLTRRLEKHKQTMREEIENRTVRGKVCKCERRT